MFDLLRRPRITAGVPGLALLLGATLVLAGCGSMGTKLQAPTASIQQLTMQSDGSWAVVVRFQNNSYDTGMYVSGIDATLSLDGKPAGHIAMAPNLGIPAMDADIATATFTPDPGGSAALTTAKGAVAYTLKGTMSAAKDRKDGAKPFELDGRGYISPVPGVSNVWR